MLKIVCEVCGSSNYIVHRAKVEIPSRTDEGQTITVFAEIYGDICEDCFNANKTRFLAATRKTIVEDPKPRRDWQHDDVKLVPPQMPNMRYQF